MNREMVRSSSGKDSVLLLIIYEVASSMVLHPLVSLISASHCLNRQGFIGAEEPFTLYAPQF